MELKIHLTMSSTIKDSEHAIIDVKLNNEILEEDLEIVAQYTEDTVIKTYEVTLDEGTHELVLHYKNDSAKFGENNEIVKDRNFILEGISIEIDEVVTELELSDVTGAVFIYEEDDIVAAKKFTNGNVVIEFDLPIEESSEPEE